MIGQPHLQHKQRRTGSIGQGQISPTRGGLLLNLRLPQARIAILGRGVPPGLDLPAETPLVQTAPLTVAVIEAEPAVSRSGSHATADLLS